MKLLGGTLLAGLLLAPPLAEPAPRGPAYPFHVGERFEYAAKLGVLRLGTAWMEVTGTDTVQGHESFVFQFGLEAEAPFYKSRNVLRSWTGVDDLVSRRFYQDLNENGKLKQRYFEIYPDSLIYRQQNRPETRASVDDPLDDAAFFYFLRTIPLEVGKTYSYHRYFKKELNPVVIKVVKRETMELPGDREVPCLVLNPVVGNDGIFAPRADAKLWLTDDGRRIPVQIRSRLPFGTVTLRLVSVRLPDSAQASR
jgi:hypothetical protein